MGKAIYAPHRLCASNLPRNAGTGLDQRCPKLLGRSSSTLSRELSRQEGTLYCARDASRRYAARRRHSVRRRRLIPGTQLFQLVRDHLVWRWSLQQLAAKHAGHAFARSCPARQSPDHLRNDLRASARRLEKGACPGVAPAQAVAWSAANERGQTHLGAGGTADRAPPRGGAAAPGSRPLGRRSDQGWVQSFLRGHLGGAQDALFRAVPYGRLHGRRCPGRIHPPDEEIARLDANALDL